MVFSRNHGETCSPEPALPAGATGGVRDRPRTQEARRAPAGHFQTYTGHLQTYTDHFQTYTDHLGPTSEPAADRFTEHLRPADKERRLECQGGDSSGPEEEDLMLRNDYDSQTCSVARALEAVGERWTLLIVRELLRRPQRFTDLERTLGIAKNVLSARLEKLLALEIVSATPVADPRDWSTYGLTEKGTALFPVVAALMAWGDTYEAPNGPPAVFVHDCGHPAGHKLICVHCEQDLVIADVRVTAGPGLDPAHPPRRPRQDAGRA
jgi:DNA-binding HxlR family transcriptional regulator